MMASVSAYVHRGASTSQVGPEFSDIGSWGGDLTTLAIDYWTTSQSNPSLDPYDFATDALTSAIESSFASEDLHSDLFAWVAAFNFQTSTLTLAESVLKAVRHTTFAGENSYDSFIRLRFGTVANGYEIVKQAFEQPGDTTDRLLFNSERTAILQVFGATPLTLLDDFEVSELRALAKALVNRIASLSTHYSPLL